MRLMRRPSSRILTFGKAESPARESTERERPRLSGLGGWEPWAAEEEEEEPLPPRLKEFENAADLLPDLPPLLDALLPPLFLRADVTAVGVPPPPSASSSTVAIADGGRCFLNDRLNDCEILSAKLRPVREEPRPEDLLPLSPIDLWREAGGEPSPTS